MQRSLQAQIALLHLVFGTVALLETGDGTHGIVKLIDKLVVRGDEYLKAQVELPASCPILFMAEAEIGIFLLDLRHNASLVLKVLMGGLEVLFLLQSERAPVVSVTTEASCK